jgi:hypothetical protein
MSSLEFVVLLKFLKEYYFHWSFSAIYFRLSFYVSIVSIAFKRLKHEDTFENMATTTWAKNGQKVPHGVHAWSCLLPSLFLLPVKLTSQSFLISCNSWTSRTERVDLFCSGILFQFLVYFSSNVSSSAKWKKRLREWMMRKEVSDLKLKLYQRILWTKNTGSTFSCHIFLLETWVKQMIDMSDASGNEWLVTQRFRM